MSRNATATGNIVSLQYVKDWLGKTGGATEDPKDQLLQSLIARASHWWEEQTGTFVRKQSYTELHRGDGTSVLHAHHFPIDTTVEPAISVRGSSPTEWNVQAVTDLEYDDPEGCGFLYWRGSVFPRSETRYNVKLVLTGGWTTALDGVGAPNDMNQAGAIAVEFLLKYRERGLHMLLASTDEDGESLQFGATRPWLTNLMAYRDTFNKYRVRPFG